MTQAMSNNWKDVMSGFGYMFGGRDRKEGSLMQDMFGNTDEYKIKQYLKSLTPQERMKLLMFNIAPVGGQFDGSIGNIENENLEKIKEKITNEYVLGSYPETKKKIKEMTKDDPDISPMTYNWTPF